MALLGLLVLLALAGPVLATWDTCRGTCGLRPLAFDHSSLVHGYKALTSDGASPGVPSGTWPGIVGVQTVLHNGTWHMCSGALIHPQWVLTVARCFYRSRDVSIYKVVIGATDLAQPGPKAVLRDVKRLVVHHGYVATTASNDIALLELEQPVECSDYIQLGCVPDSALAVPELKTCYMAGWRATAGSGQCPRGHSLALGMRPGLAQGLGHAGCPGHSGHRGHSGHSVPSLVLQEAKVRLMDVQLCNSSRWYGGAVHPQDLCAGYPRGGIDTCQGDVGAPLVCKDKVGDFFWLVGLASWGRRCSGRKRPGVFTSIQHFHGWIQEQLRLASIKPVWRPKKPGLIPSLAPFLSPTPTLMLTVLKESPEVDSDSFITISFPKDVKVILQRFFRTLQEFLEILKDRMS